jgi:hypothetical protein
MKKEDIKIAGETYISNNSASIFRSCPFRFDLEYRQKIVPKKENISFYFGKCIHQALDYYFSEAKDLDMALEYFDSVFMGSLNEREILWSGDPRRKDGGDFRDAQSTLDYVKRMLEAYINYWFDVNMGLDVLASEVDFEYEIDCDGSKILYTGIIDKIVSIDGKTYILDHKTYAQSVDRELLNVENQISGYYLGAKSLGYDVSGAIFDILYKKKEPVFERIYVDRTDQEIVDFMQDTKDTIHAIKAGYKFRNLGYNCKNCKYKQYCFNGKCLGDNYAKIE